MGLGDKPHYSKSLFVKLFHPKELGVLDSVWGMGCPFQRGRGPRVPKEDHGLYSSVDPSYAVSRGLKILTTLFAWTRGVLIWSLWTPRVKKICFKKLGKNQIFVFLGTKIPMSRALVGPNGRDFNTRTVGV